MVRIAWYQGVVDAVVEEEEGMWTPQILPAFVE
jgi:hypothetical protein